MSFFFRKRRIRKFAEKAVEQKNTIFVFGSNIFAEALIDRLIELGAHSRVALISEKKLVWVDEIKDKINVLIEENKEEYSKRNIYETIGFQNAEKLIILHEDPVIIQDIISFISDENLKVILLAQFAPPFVKYLAGQKRGQFLIVDNLFQIVRQLYEEMGLSLGKPPVISIPIPKSRLLKPVNDLSIPKVKVLNILRESAKKRILPLNEPTQEDDRLLIYLEDPKDSLKNLVDFLDRFQ